MKIKSIVEQVLQDSPRSRNSDKWLLIRTMQKYGLNLAPAQEQIFLDMPAYETITRERRKFQEAGLYPATTQTAQARSTASQVIQQRIPTTKPENIGKLFDDASYKTRNFG